MPERDSKNSEMSRRECMGWLARAAASVAIADLCGLSAQCGEKDGQWVKIGDLISLPNETAVEIAKQNVILTRTKEGVASLSIFCTHRHNRLDVENGAIVCPVHDSMFDLSGKPLTGPASRPLSSYLTSINDDGAISVDASKSVKTGTWAELPAWAKPKK